MADSASLAGLRNGHIPRTLPRQRTTSPTRTDPGICASIPISRVPDTVCVRQPERTTSARLSLRMNTYTVDISCSTLRKLSCPPPALSQGRSAPPVPFIPVLSSSLFHPSGTLSALPASRFTHRLPLIAKSAVPSVMAGEEAAVLGFRLRRARRRSGIPPFRETGRNRNSGQWRRARISSGHGLLTGSSGTAPIPAAESGRDRNAFRKRSPCPSMEHDGATSTSG